MVWITLGCAVSLLIILAVKRGGPGKDVWGGLAVAGAFAVLGLITFFGFRRIVRDLEDGFGQEWGRREHRVHRERDALRLELQQDKARVRDLSEALKNAKLQTSRLHAVFSQLSHPVAFLDLHGKILDLNASASELFCESPRNLRGRNVFSLPVFKLADDPMPRLTRAVQGEMVRFQQTLAGPEGETHTLSMSLKAVFGDRGSPELLILEGQDITERLKAEAAFEETFQQFQQSQKMEAVGRLAGGIAHDFNNLLTSILGFSHMALEEIPGDLDAVEDVKEVILAATRAQNLTQKLLAISRKELINSHPVELNRLVRDMNKLIRLTLHENIEIVTELSPDLCTILADTTSLEQVILNLAVNARDAMPRSGRLYIRTGICDVDTPAGIIPEPPPGRYVIFSMRDTGCGMSEELLSHVFEPFFTTKETGQGTGLGLSTVYAIMKQYRGGIQVSSEPGVGTEFKLYFPLHETAEQMLLDLPVAVRGPPLKGEETILLVEDEDGVRRMASKMIESLGYTLLAACDGEEGVRIAEAHDGNIDLIITDVVMPNLSGPEMIDRLRISLGHIPYLYVSGFTMDKLVEHGADDSMENLIRKPYSRESLARRIREALDAVA